MLVFDTNVLSEIIRSRPAPGVARWVAQQDWRLVFTTAVSKGEILAGIAMMRLGRRRRDLEDLARNLFGTGLRDRVLAFDDGATADFATISRLRRRAGRPIGTADLIIAAIARSRHATVVTRDVGGFELTGVPLINPWDQP